MAVIEFEAVTKRFGDVVAVDGLSFTVDQGNVVGFLGPNGAGKTTTLRMLLGLVAPSGGRATINGSSLPATTQSAPRRRRRARILGRLPGAHRSQPLAY